MKFCMILEFFVPHYNGGGERRYYELTKRLVQLGHEVDVLTMKLDGVDDHEVIDDVNVYHIGPVVRNPPIRTKSDFILYGKSVLGWLRSHKYDVIDAQSYSPLLPASIYSKMSNTPIIGTIYDTSTNNNDQWLQSSTIASMAEKVLVKMPFNKILTISKATRKSLIKDFNVDSDKINLIYIGVDLDGIDKVKCTRKSNDRILFVGRLVPHKHVDHLLRILNNIKDKYPDVHLVIVGKGVEKENLTRYIEDNNLGDYVEFMQDLSNEELIYQMKLANVLVLPSTREGFGMVLSEANACCTPTVCYASGGVVEVVDDEKTGYLVKPEDVDALEERIEYILDNKDVEETLGKQGRLNVEEKFNWDKIVLQYINLASKLVNCCKLNK